MDFIPVKTLHKSSYAGAELTGHYREVAIVARFNDSNSKYTSCHMLGWKNRDRSTYKKFEIIER